MQPSEKKPGKPKYEKPTVTDLSYPLARAQQTEALCTLGAFAGEPQGQCGDGFGPADPDNCTSGTDPSPSTWCSQGPSVKT